MEAEKKRVLNADLIITLIIAALCVYMLVASDSFKLLGKLFPQVIAGATLLACVAQLFISLKKAGAVSGKVKKEAQPSDRNYLVIIAAALIYLALLPFAGFILTTLALMVAIPAYLGNRNKRLIWILGLVLTLSFYFIFKIFFYVPLPQGVLTFI